MALKEYKKLNSTGTYSRHIPTDTIYSYRTPIYQEFCTRIGKLKVFNDTYYSATTRKHQALAWRYSAQSDIVFHYCPFGYWGLDTAFKNEISMVEYEIEKLENKKRKLGVRQAEQLIDLRMRLKFLQKLYSQI